jgi:hypothetical protein
LILHWQQKLSHSQTKTLHNPSILKKQVMKGQPSSCNSQPIVYLRYLSMAEVEQRKKKIRSTAAWRTVLIHVSFDKQEFNHMI